MELEGDGRHMKVTKVDLPVTIITGPADDMDKQRSPGLHLSDIYQSLENDLSESQRSKKAGISLDMLEVYRAGGFIWERTFSRAMGDALVGEEWERPQEWVRDGISCSPDLISTRDWMLGETKFTWKSSRRMSEFIESGTGPLWVWGVQMMGYCHVISTNRARLFAYFVNGNYKTMQPEWQVHDFEFTPRELKENWDMLKNHARNKKWL
jgi:hypothetical protein